MLARQTTATDIYPLSLHDALPIFMNRLEIQLQGVQESMRQNRDEKVMLENALTTAESTAATFSSIAQRVRGSGTAPRSEEHTSELQSQSNLVCRLLLEKKKTNIAN